MIAVDSSVAIAGFASWHDSHAAARKVLERGPRLVAHAALETYSVLTRLPAPHRAQPGLVADYLRRRFPGPLLSLPPDRHDELVSALAHRNIAGGQVYDALIGLTATAHAATLVSLDRRAALVYEAVGTVVELPT
jgi:predicted nucleic acid-binding protein